MWSIAASLVLAAVHVSVGAALLLNNLRKRNRQQIAPGIGSNCPLGGRKLEKEVENGRAETGEPAPANR